VEQACAALSKVRLNADSDWFDVGRHDARVIGRLRPLGRHSLGGPELSGRGWYIRYVQLEICFDCGPELVLGAPEFSHCPGQGAGYFREPFRTHNQEGDDEDDQELLKAPSDLKHRYVLTSRVSGYTRS
jgi:hypothetical protein